MSKIIFSGVLGDITNPREMDFIFHRAGGQMQNPCYNTGDENWIFGVSPALSFLLKSIEQRYILRS